METQKFKESLQSGLAMFALVIALVFTTIGSYAKTMSPDEALSRFKTSSGFKGMKSAGPEYRLVSNKGYVYIFSRGDSGFIVLAADDVAPLLLGYSDSGEYKEGVNPAFDSWLDSYSKEIEYAINSGMPSYNESATPHINAKNSMATVEPIVKTEWNQMAPYNDMCPKVNGHETVTGCVATAMSQVIRTHEWPVHGKGTKSYDWHAEYDGFTVDSTLTFDYASTIFDYTNMPYRYDKESTEVQKKAVAQLMLACGISVNMGYNIGESGASTRKMGASLIDIFDYDISVWMPQRDYYPLDEWESMIYADLAKGLPVLYSGFGTAGGHQFICDGYDGNGYYHFNWGWGGMSNGYFLLDALNPGSLGVGGGAGGFNYDQTACLNVMKPKADSKYRYLIYCLGNLTANKPKIKTDEELYLEGPYYNYSMHKIPDNTYFGVAIISAANDTTYVVGNKVEELDPLYGIDNVIVKWPALENGTYTLIPTFKDCYGNWHKIRTSLDKYGSYIVTVKDGETTLTREEKPDLKVTALTLDSKLFIDTNASVSFTVENDGDSEYIWNVAPALLDASGKVVAKGGTLEVDLAAGAKRVIDKDIIKFTAVADSTLPPGNYTLTVIDTDNNKSLADTAIELPVTLEDKPAVTKLEISDFKIASPDPVTDKDDVKFTLTLKCTEGYCSDNLQMYIFHAYGGYDVMSKSIESPLISAGESTDMTVDLDMKSIEAGQYMAIIYYEGKEVSDAVYFQIKDDVPTGIDEIGSEAKGPYYDLSGRRLTAPPAHGLYIDSQRVRFAR